MTDQTVHYTYNNPGTSACGTYDVYDRLASIPSHVNCGTCLNSKVYKENRHKEKVMNESLTHYISSNSSVSACGLHSWLDSYTSMTMNVNCSSCKASDVYKIDHVTHYWPTKFAETACGSNLSGILTTVMVSDVTCEACKTSSRYMMSGFWTAKESTVELVSDNSWSAEYDVRVTKNGVETVHTCRVSIANAELGLLTDPKRNMREFAHQLRLLSDRLAKDAS